MIDISKVFATYNILIYMREYSGKRKTSNSLWKIFSMVLNH